MTSPQASGVWQWFQTIAPESYFDELLKQHPKRRRNRIYGTGVVIWLMIFQRLQGDASLLTAVLALPARWKRGAARISVATGAYCQARQRLPTLLVKQVSDHVFETMHAQARGPRERPVFLVDGTSLLLEHEPDLLRAFPPGRNRLGENRWPVLKLVAFHDAHTGLATRPQWGPMYGEEAVSEQWLAAQALDRLPAGALVLADANFGIFAFAHAVVGTQRPVLLRLTASRVRKILRQSSLKQVAKKTLPKKSTRRKVLWTPSAWEMATHPDLPTQAQLEGWVVTCAHPQKPKEKLYFFTTLEQSPKQILVLYKLRWNIETDLRNLKRTVNLHQLRGRSVEVVENELLLAVTAYNLVRTVMFQAAQSVGCTPRQLSFAHVQAAVLAALPALEQAGSPSLRQQRMRELVDLAAQLKLPKRKRKRRSYPRQVWRRGASFPHRSVTPSSQERSK